MKFLRVRTPKPVRDTQGFRPLRPLTPAGILQPKPRAQGGDDLAGRCHECACEFLVVGASWEKVGVRWLWEVWVRVGVPAVWRSVCVAACSRHEPNVTDATTCQKHKAPARGKINVADATQSQKRKARTFGVGYDFDSLGA